MNRDTVIRLAREAGFKVDGNDVLEGDGYHIQTAKIERFAALVAQAEREECAKVCDEYAKNSSNPMNFAENCADAIRSRT